MPQLGATLEELVDLEGRLRTSAGAIETQNRSTATATTNAVTTLNEGSNTARTQIEGFMAELNADVGQVYRDTLGTDWTGQNRENFLSNYQTFQTQMNAAATATNNYFTDLQSAITTMMNNLTDYQGELSTALTAAQTASESMGTAVAGQRQNLDTAMNTGMTF